MNLNAYVNHEFDRGFLLKEEDLTKLLDIIKIRASEVGALDGLRIKVYRSDSLVYEAVDLDLLRNEENAIRNKITRVQILLAHDDLKIVLDFDEDENTSIKIESTDRDRAYLLYSELKEYLNTEVLVFRNSSKRHERLLWMVLPMMIMMIVSSGALILFTQHPKLDEAALKALIDSGDIKSKLDHLISAESAKNGERSLILFLPLTIILAMAVEPCLRWTQNHWYPRNVFYFGKEKNRYDQLLERRSKWTWGGFVAFIVSGLAGFAVWIITKD